MASAALVTSSAHCPAKEAGIFYSTLYAKTMEVEWTSGFGGDASAWFLVDVNGDGMDDAVVYYGKEERKGQYYAALSDGRKFGKPFRLDSFVAPVAGSLLCDADGDGFLDKVYREGSTWKVAYSNGASFEEPAVPWILGLGDIRGGKQNPPPVVAALTGSLDGKKGWACLVDEAGRWFAVANPARNNPLDLVANETYVSWRCAYEPQLPGHEGAYDSGDPAVHDVQIKMLHDAGFTYVTMDITNGETDWVDERAHRFFQSVRRWNESRKPGQRKLFVHVSLGRTRGVRGETAFFEKLNSECRRAWDEFVLPYQDLYYHLNGKPLVVHMINTGYDYIDKLDGWDGDRSYMDRCSNRWMSGDQPGAHTGRPNTYGWIVPGMYGNPIHQEMMPVMPGFWNAITYFDREGGDLYRTQWLRVLENQPDSVWVNSLNETWEHTSVEPAFMFNTREPHRGITPWTDLHGGRMDDFYWVMTRQYLKLFMENALYEGSFVQEFVAEHRFGPVMKATMQGFAQQDELPHQAPVLLVPGGFMKKFDGKVVEDKGWRAACETKQATEGETHER